MEEIAGWVAPAATMIAAMMTAANLGARFTGWGFIVFTVGSIGWILVALGSGQQNLLATNAFLTIVNLVGVWRWLGRRAKFDDAARHAEAQAERAGRTDLFATSSLEGRPVHGSDGAVLGSVVDALTSCHDGRIAFLIIREGGVAGIGETLRKLDWRDARMSDAAILTRLDARGVAALPVAPTG